MSLSLLDCHYKVPIATKKRAVTKNPPLNKLKKWKKRDQWRSKITTKKKKGEEKANEKKKEKYSGDVKPSLQIMSGSSRPPLRNFKKEKEIMRSRVAIIELRKPYTLTGQKPVKWSSSGGR